MNTFRSSRLQLQSNVKAGTVNGLATNHNESLQVASKVKAGIRIPNHNETLKVASQVKAGDLGLATNHNESLADRRRN